MSDLYSDGRHYDFFLGDQSADIPFYLGQAGRAKGAVLELACGTGRLTLPLARAGVNITGLDSSGPMLDRAKEKASHEGLNIPWVHGDALDFDLRFLFDLIFLPFNSLQHFHDRGSLERLFERVRAHLAPGGRFVLDVHQPNLALLNRHPGEIYPVEGLGQAPDGTVVTGEEVAYDDARQVYRIRWHYSLPEDDRAVPERVDELNLRMFFPVELDALLHYNGFEILEKFGDFNSKKFEAGDLKQIVVCGLRAS